MRLETERLILRDLVPEDFGALRRIMDPDTMWAYGHAFTDADVAAWLSRQIERREIWGFSLCAVELRETGELIGQCGLTVQDLFDMRVPEIGYVFSRERWHHGYATEAAMAVRDRAFGELGLGEVYAMVRDVNHASRRVALRLGMRPAAVFMKRYRGMDMPHIAYRLRREET